MNIAFNKRHSKFLAPCEAVIRERRTELNAGEILQVHFEEGGGLQKELTVTIDQADTSEFQTDWEELTHSLFPARIKAAATALLNCGIEGSYSISHDDGRLTIQKV